MATEVEEPRTDSDQEKRGDQEDQEGGPVKTFLEHLEDLRWVLIKSAVAVGICMFLCLIAGNHVMQILEWPLRHAKIRYPGTNQVWTVSFGTNRLGTFHLNDAQQATYSVGTNRYVALNVEPFWSGTNFLLRVVPDLKAAAATGQGLKVDLVNLSPVGAFVVALQVALYGGLVLASPFVFYYIATFIFPALRKIERHYTYRGLGFGLGLFMAGVLFCYFVLLPLALAASVSYSNWFGFSANQWKAEDYISFSCKFMIGMGIGFQMPVVLLTLVKVGVLNYSILSKMRRYMIVINLVLGAVLTSPEPITQVLMALPLQVLYEISVWVAWYWERRDRKRAEKEAQEGGPAKS